jgi:uncharacterized protein YbjT (DUF2867 family)
VIGVLGATGTTGGAVIAALVRDGIPARAIVRARSPKIAPSIDQVVADTNDVRSCIAALGGVRALFLAMANGPEQRANELTFVHAAQRACVEHVVKVSAPVVGRDVKVAIARMHGEIEAVIETSGMAFTHLRPYAFMSNLLTHAGTIRTMGVLFGCTGHAPINWVSPLDIADVAAHALARPDLRGQALVLTGAEAVSMPEIARRLTNLGVSATFVDQSGADLRKGLARTQLPPWLVEHIIEIQTRSVEFPEAPTDTVERVLGRAPRRLDDFLAANVLAFRGPPRFAGRLVGRLLAMRSRT